MTRWTPITSQTQVFSKTRRQSLIFTVLLALSLTGLASTGLGCGDGMLDFGTGGEQSESIQQAHTNGRYKAPASVAEAGRRQAGNISYDDADRCIGTGTPILDGTDRLARFLRDNFDGATRYDSTVYCRSVRGGRSLSMHATGRAIDLYIPTIGEQADNSAGDPVANYLIRNATTLGVQYFIWDKTQFNTSRGYTEDYCRGRCWEHGGGKHPHHDHLHIELTKQSANHLRVADIPPVGASGGSSGGSSSVAPDTPAIVSPTDGESVWTEDVTVSAEQVAGALGYTFDIQRYDGNQWQRYYTYDADQSSKRFWPASKAAYRWRVKVTTGGGTSDYSGWSTFWFGVSSSTDDGSSGSSNPPSSPTSNAPIGLSPTAGERLYTDSVTITCDAVTGATGYEFEVQYHDGQVWRDYYTYEPKTAAKKFWPYVQDTAHRFRVRAYTSSGWTDYSQWSLFLYGDASSL